MAKSVRVSKEKCLAGIEIITRKDVLVQPTRAFTAELGNDGGHISWGYVGGPSDMKKAALAPRAGALLAGPMERLYSIPSQDSSRRTFCDRSWSAPRYHHKELACAS